MSKLTDNQQRIVEQHFMRFLWIPEMEFFAEMTSLELIEFFDFHGYEMPLLDSGQ